MTMGMSCSTSRMVTPEPRIFSTQLHAARRSRTDSCRIPARPAAASTASPPAPARCRADAARRKAGCRRARDARCSRPTSCRISSGVIARAPARIGSRAAARAAYPTSVERPRAVQADQHILEHAVGLEHAGASGTFAPARAWRSRAASVRPATCRGSARCRWSASGSR